MKKARFIVLRLLLAMLFVPFLAFAQQQAPQAKLEAVAPAEHQHGAAAKPSKHQGMSAGKEPRKMEMYKDMMAMHDKMVADMKAMDARLDEKVTAMNAAEGDQNACPDCSWVHSMLLSIAFMTAGHDSTLAHPLPTR
jgi:vancomycin resistance protein YoaR